MTPHEFALACEGYQDYLKQGVSNAWMTSRLFHCDPKKFPSLDKILNPPKILTVQEKQELVQEMDKIKRLMNAR